MNRSRDESSEETTTPQPEDIKAEITPLTYWKDTSGGRA